VSLLKLDKIAKHFGGLKAIDDLSFQIEKNQIFGLIGPNGAGKTTTYNCITGYFPVTSGEILFNDEKVTGLNPHILARMGLVRTFQANRFFPEMTVWENVLVPYEYAHKVNIFSELLFAPSYKKKAVLHSEKVEEILSLTGLLQKSKFAAKNLPHGDQRRLGIAIALAAEPKLLLLDEPLTGMTADEMGDLLVLIRKVRDSGVTICLIEHNMRAVMTTCDYITVIQYGKKIAEGLPQEIANNEQVIEAYLGRRKVQC
jgi:branched-chain amino acid transport system ATP-binding protein